MRKDVIDLCPYLDKLYELLADLLDGTGWSMVDRGLFEYNFGTYPNDDVEIKLSSGHVVLYPSILEYWEGEQYIETVWLRCDDYIWSAEAKKKFFDVVPYFKDEDYNGLSFWINPLYPDGYWCNHVLGE